MQGMTVTKSQSPWTYGKSRTITEALGDLLARVWQEILGGVCTTKHSVFNQHRYPSTPYKQRRKTHLPHCGSRIWSFWLISRIFGDLKRTRRTWNHRIVKISKLGKNQSFRQHNHSSDLTQKTPEINKFQSPLRVFATILLGPLCRVYIPCHPSALRITSAHPVRPFEIKDGISSSVQNIAVQD